VHLLVIDPPKVHLSELVNSLKGVSSRRLKVEFPAIPTFWSVHKSESALWSRAILLVRWAAPLLRSFVENQERSDPPGVNAGARRAIRSLWDQIEMPEPGPSGGESDLLLRSTAIEMLARNANARFLEIPHCGHMPPLLDAEQIRIVIDWINARSVGLAAVNPPRQGSVGRHNAREQGPPGTR
jgi:pimeloyl-ACP methyl ester carboxylesterase